MRCLEQALGRGGADKAAMPMLLDRVTDVAPSDGYRAIKKADAADVGARLVTLWRESLRT